MGDAACRSAHHRHSGESQNPAPSRAVNCARDTGFRRYDRAGFCRDAAAHAQNETFTGWIRVVRKVLWGGVQKNLADSLPNRVHHKPRPQRQQRPADCGVTVKCHQKGDNENCNGKDGGNAQNIDRLRFFQLRCVLHFATSKNHGVRPHYG